MGKIGLNTLKRPVFLLICVSIFIIFSNQLPLEAKVVDRIVAFVNSDIITMQDIDQELRPMLKQRPNLSQDEINKLQRQILDELINRKIIEQEAQKLEIRISDQEVDLAIERIKKGNNIDQEQFETELERMGVNLAQFKKSIRSQLSKNKIIDKEIRFRVVIPEHRIMAYYRDNIGELTKENKVHLRHMVFELSAGASEEETMTKAEKIKAEIEKGLDFVDAVLKYAESEGISKNYDMGMIKYNDLASMIREAIDGLEAGQVSRPIKLGQTIQLLQVVEWDRTGQKITERTRTRIQEQLMAEEIEKRFQDWLQKARDRSIVKIKF